MGKMHEIPAGEGLRNELHIQLLGGFAVAVGGVRIPDARWKSRRGRNLVKLLALAPGHRLHRDQVCETFWPGSAPSAAANNFHRTVYVARQVLEAHGAGGLVLEDSFLTLAAGPGQVLRIDVEQFEAAAALAKGSQDPRAYQEARACYTGDLLPDDLYEEWTHQLREALRQTCLQLLLELARLHETRQEYPQGIAALQQAISIEKCLEEAHAELMRLYALTGQPQQAARQYKVLQDVLSQELGEEPGHATTQLYETVQSGRFPPASLRSQPAHNLPLELTPFIGRQREIVQVQELLRAHRLVTLTGSGGVGKTRLSIQVARQMLAEMTNGIWYVELAPISDSDRVPQIVAAALGLREEPNRPLMETLSNFLVNRELMIVLDNCEHLLEACARLADALLRKAPRLKIFVTSREALGIKGEYAFRVPSLTVPDRRQLPDLKDINEYESVCLFVERSRAVLPNFTVSERNVLAIVQICRRLDGIPLALELAAARLNLLAPEQLASRLDSVFHVLTRGSRTALPRQQTLRATIDWSYDLLSAAERILLRRLAVFAGGSTLEAIEAVCTGEGLEADQILDLLSGLVNKSMISAVRKQPEETRYQLLETVRQYAREKLYEAKEIQAFYDRHLDYYLELGEVVEPELRTAVAVERLQMLDREVENLRSALSWALDDPASLKIEVGLRLASALLNFWHTQNYQNEGYTWLIKGLSAKAVIPSDTSVRARACFAAGHLIFPLGRTAESRQWLQESLAIYRKIEDASGVIMAQSMLGEVLSLSGSFDEANELCAASIALCRTLDDPWLLAWVLGRFGRCKQEQDDYILERQLLEESITIFESVGDILQVGDIFIMLGRIAGGQKEYQESNEYFNRALSSGRAMQSKWMIALSLANLGSLAYLKEEFNKMQVYLLESVTLGRETGSQHIRWFLSLLGYSEINLAHPQQAVLQFRECLQISSSSLDMPEILLGMARAALQMRQARTGAQLLGAGKRLANMELRFSSHIAQKEYERGLAEAKTQLDESELERAISEGEALNLEEAVALALAVKITAEPNHQIKRYGHET